MSLQPRNNQNIRRELCTGEYVANLITTQGFKLKNRFVQFLIHHWQVQNTYLLISGLFFFIFGRLLELILLMLLLQLLLKLLLKLLLQLVVISSMDMKMKICVDGGLDFCCFCLSFCDFGVSAFLVFVSSFVQTDDM